MEISPADVQGGFCIDMIKVTAPCRKDGGEKKKRGDKVRVRIQHPLWGTTLAKLDAGKGRERERDALRAKLK